VLLLAFLVFGCSREVRENSSHSAPVTPTQEVKVFGNFKRRFPHWPHRKILSRICSQLTETFFLTRSAIFCTLLGQLLFCHVLFASRLHFFFLNFNLKTGGVHNLKHLRAQFVCRLLRPQSTPLPVGFQTLVFFPKNIYITFFFG